MAMNELVAGDLRRTPVWDDCASSADKPRHKAESKDQGKNRWPHCDLQHLKPCSLACLRVVIVWVSSSQSGCMLG